MVKFIAHRGFSKGPLENTKEGILKAVQENIDGIEIDLWLENNEIVLSHNKPKNNISYPTLEEVFQLDLPQNWIFMLELKQADKKLFKEVERLVVKYNMESRTYIIAFRNIAKHFPWQNTNLSTGVIFKYPFLAYVFDKRYNPALIGLGWSDNWASKPVQKILFKLSWYLFKLNQLNKYKIFFTGIASSKKGLIWLLQTNPEFISIDINKETKEFLS